MGTRAAQGGASASRHSQPAFCTLPAAVCTRSSARWQRGPLPAISQIRCCALRIEESARQPKSQGLPTCPRARRVAGGWRCALVLAADVAESAAPSVGAASGDSSSGGAARFLSSSVSSLASLTSRSCSRASNSLMELRFGTGSPACGAGEPGTSGSGFSVLGTHATTPTTEATANSMDIGWRCARARPKRPSRGDMPWGSMDGQVSGHLGPRYTTRRTIT